MEDTAPAFTWDQAKSDKCLRERGFDFEYAARVFDGSEMERVDNRKNYGEVRIQAMGGVEGRLLVVVYTQRGVTKHIISARRAHQKELKRWSQ